MNKTGLWFWFSCKRQLKRPAFLLMLLMLPFLLAGSAKFGEKDDSGIRIALYAGDDEFTQDIIDSLVNAEGMFQFYQCRSGQELKDDVASRRAECGYLFLPDFKEKLDKGKYRRSIGVYSAPSTVAASLSTEVVFSRIMEVYGRELLLDYTMTGEVFGDLNRQEAWDEMEQLYNQYYGNGSTFSFRYETEDRTELKKQGGKAVFPVRGIAAVYVFVTGIFAAVSLCTDEKKGLFIPVPFHQKPWCSIASMLGPVFLAACSGFMGIWLSGSMDRGIAGKAREAGIMAAYVLIVVMAAWILKLLVKNPLALCGLIPFLTMASLALCPVFLDIGMWIPGLDNLARLFPPYYYLSFF